MKKMFLSFAVVAGVVLAACNNKSEGGEETPAADTTAVVEETPAVDTAVAAVDTAAAKVEAAAEAVKEEVKK